MAGNQVALPLLSLTDFVSFPAILQRAGKAACFAADEFFAAKISNPHTRRAYARRLFRYIPSRIFYPVAVQPCR